MKIRRMISVVLAVLMLASLFTVAASAADSDVAETGAANSNYLENYAKAAVESGETLGAVYTPAATTFKVWAPEAESVMVKMFTTGTDAESGASTVGTFPMTYNSSTGIWTLTKSGDFKDKYYTYLVTRSGVVKETVDPYAKAVGANGDRGMVVDLDSTDPDGWDKDSHVLFSNPGDAVVWEIHVRDFSIDVSSGVSEANRGKYLAFTEGNTTVNGAGKIASCVDYLVEHNVNCVQLMPIEDFASIDETDARVNRNWGYDPKNYNVPEGSYSSDPYNGNTRITEFKMLVQALHDRGISVVMDVVYNHTFVREGSPFSKTVPKYYYRMSNMNTNSYNNGSGLGNVLSTEKAMTRKFVQDSLVYWATEYHVDGFRFDLMGCHDRPAVQAWRTALDKVDSRILMYGEPWAGGSDNGISNAVSKSTMSQLTRVGAFNEGYSDALKGSHETATGTGFLNGGAATEILKAAGGSASDFSGAKVEQFINYTDNHDNWTLFDKILAANKTANFKTAKDDPTLYNKNKSIVDNPSSQVLGQMKIGLTSALTSQGIPFTVAGTEFARTKYGDQNSYRSPDNMNAINWNRAEKYAEIANYYAGLVAIRKAVSAFGDTTANAVSTVSGATAWQITNSKSGQWNKVIVALNPSSSAKSITCSGSWTVVANGTKAGTTSLGTASGSYSVPAWSSVVLVDSASFGNYSQPALGTASLTVEHYTRDSASGSYTKALTETAKYKEGQTWRASKNLALLFDHNFDKAESTASNATYGTATAGQNITVKFYYTRNIASGYLTVNFLNTSSNASVKTPMKYRLHDGDAYSIPATPVQGYELDTSKYPAKSIGTFDASNPPTFNFYYKPLSNQTTKVHYYNTKGWSYVNVYAYDDQGNEALGSWATQSKKDKMTDDPDQADSKWLVKEVPTTACYVMFHDATNQVPDQGEPGYAVAGEAWIKDGVVTFSCSVVTSHIDLETGSILSPDVKKDYSNVGSNQTYTTSANNNLNRNYVAPALASGFYQAGVLNAVYLYTDAKPITDKQMYGDLDNDGYVTIMDVTVLQRANVKMITLTADQKTVADVNGDGAADAVDATTIQRYLAEIKVKGSKVGQIVGEAPVGEHTYDEFLTVYNQLNSGLAQYPSATYGSDPYYQAAAAALNTYRATSMNPSADPDDIDAGYDACSQALAGLANIQKTDPTTPPTPDTVTLYFSNNKGWDGVNVYMWSDGGESTAWPGVAADYVGNNDYGEGIYSVTVDTNSYDKVIFNGSGGQTEDVDVAYAASQGCGLYCLDEQNDLGHYLVGYYEYTGTGGGGGGGGESGISFLLTDNFGWGTAYVYAWDDDGNELNGAWPGSAQAETLTNDYGETQFKCYVPEGATGIILSNGNGAQTEDIKDFGSYAGYWMDGTQNELGHYKVIGWN